MRNRNTGNSISLATFSLLKPYLSFGWQSKSDCFPFCFSLLSSFSLSNEISNMDELYCDGSACAFRSLSYPKRIRILIRELRVKNYSKSTKKKWRREENKKIRNASSHLCQGIYYSNDVEWVKVSPSREVWKEYDLRKHEKKKIKLNSHSFLFSHFEGLQKYITKGLSFLRLGD